MDVKPTHEKTMDYGLRWGIESIFSDLKTRRFSITKTQLTTEKHVETLLMILGFAMLFAVLIGKGTLLSAPSKKQKRSLTSSFKTGLRIIVAVIITRASLPIFML